MSMWETQGVKRKVFISFYHKDDQYYRNRFSELFGHMIINCSVDEGEINSDNSSEYIKRLIQKDYINNASVVIVLIGPNTKNRKHVDWEISAALNKKVGGYSGLIGLLLPSHPNYHTEGFDTSYIPSRLADNVNSGYAKIYNWTDDSIAMARRIDMAFSARIDSADKINNSRIQMARNL